MDLADLLPESIATLHSEDTKEKGKKREHPKNHSNHNVGRMLLRRHFCDRIAGSIQDSRSVSLPINNRPAARKYKGPGWQTYDAIFGQQAANDKYLKWANVNTSLWTTVFCNASPQEHCSTCLSLDHTLKDCPQQQGSKIIDAPSAPDKSDSSLAAPICVRFNSQGCHSTTCSLRHICLECHGHHRRTRCPLSYRPCP